MVRIKKSDWPKTMFHGTSSNGLARLRRARSTKALWLTDSESTASDYAYSAARGDGSAPVIVQFDPKVMASTAGATCHYDVDDEGDVIPEEFVYSGPFSPHAVMDVKEEGER
jgi:hypothetical protein